MLSKILLPTIFLVPGYGFRVSPDFKTIIAGVAIFLFGVLSLEDPQDTLRGMMHPGEAALNALDWREQIVEVPDQYRLDSLPGVDGEGMLMGVVIFSPPSKL